MEGVQNDQNWEARGVGGINRYFRVLGGLIMKEYIYCGWIQFIKGVKFRRFKYRSAVVLLVVTGVG